MNWHRVLDRVQQWWRYPQPNWFQRRLTGQYTDVIDTEFTALRQASEESARYVQLHMRTVPNFSCDYDLHDWVVNTQLDANLVSRGIVLEFGVATGRTLNQFARLLPSKFIHGFDSFEGLPEDWTSRMPRGFFKRDNLPRVRDNSYLYVGWFNETLPQWKALYANTPLLLLHIDCDLYSSTKTVLTELRENIVLGTVIIFDEYLNYPGWQQDEFAAWKEFCRNYNVKYEYIGRVSRHQQVAVRVISVG
jgi:hypothetical protein